MNRRVVLWLGIAALAVIVAAFWPSRLGPEAQPGGKLWPGLAAALNEIASIRLSRGDGSAVTLTRKAQGWQVGERDFAADTGKIRKLLLDLAALEIAEEKTADAQRYAALGVEAPSTPAATGTLIQLWSAGKAEGAPAYALIAGKSAGSRDMYGRRPEAATSLLLRPSIVVDTAPARWLDSSLLDIKADSIQRLERSGADAPNWRLARAAAKDATLKLEPIGKNAEKVDDNAVSGLLGSFTNLSFDDVRASSALPAAERLRIDTFDGLGLEIAGVRDGEKRWVRLSVSGASEAARTRAADIERRAQGREFELPGWKYDTLFRKRSELAPPPERG